jgi:hypothetical protein
VFLLALARVPTRAFDQIKVATDQAFDCRLMQIITTCQPAENNEADGRQLIKS